MPSTPLGWPVGSRVVTSWHRIPGTNVSLRFKQGPAGDLLATFALAFHKLVEPIHDPGCWSYAHRKVTGSSTKWSEHAGGTAVDLNAPQHPLGRRGTFSAAEVAAIRRLLAACEGTVRWGGDYKGRADEMHFELLSRSAVSLQRARNNLLRLL